EGEMTKMRSPQMIGEPPPQDGKSARQTMCSSGLQVVGRFVLSLVPLAFGPRQAGQFSAARTPVATTAISRAAAQISRQRIRNTLSAGRTSVVLATAAPTTLGTQGGEIDRQRRTLHRFKLGLLLFGEHTEQAIVRLFAQVRHLGLPLLARHAH